MKNIGEWTAGLPTSMLETLQTTDLMRGADAIAERNRTLRHFPSHLIGAHWSSFPIIVMPSDRIDGVFKRVAFRENLQAAFQPKLWWTRMHGPEEHRGVNVFLRIMVNSVETGHYGPLQFDAKMPVYYFAEQPDYAAELLCRLFEFALCHEMDEGLMVDGTHRRLPHVGTR